MNEVLQPSFLESLNPAQLAAVTYRHDQSLLVLAGAGSGKTRVLTSRIIWLLSTGKCIPQNILAVTFTNKAAKEMHSRIEKLSPYSIHHMWLGTFHSLCHRILRIHHKAAQLKSNFQIIDTQDQLSIIKRILKDHQAIDSAYSDITPKELVNYINRSKEQGYRSHHLALTNNSLHHLLNSCYKIYEQICQKEQLVDFAELLLRCIETLQNDPSLQDSLRQRFSHILVDEFQDTNNLQYIWLKLMKGHQSTLFIVGDDDQSIYSFRGANVKNMSYAIRDFNMGQLKLEQNYRSTQVILDAANQLISLNQNRIGKNLQSTRQRGELIQYIQTYSELEEAQFVVNKIQSLHHNGQNYNSIAILYRNNAQSQNIEQSLFNASIPYKIYGGLRFYEREEIKHALAYLRLLVNPDDDYSLLRIINVPPRGIGKKILNALQQIAQEQHISLWSALLQEKANNKYLVSFYQIIHHLQKQINTLKLPDLIRELIHHSGLIDYYQQRKEKGKEESEAHKIDNLFELINATINADYQNLNLLLDTENTEVITTKDNIIAFLSNASLESGERHSQNLNKSLTDYVQLMTIHSAKGLEFDTVFLLAMEKGIFPSEYSLYNADSLEEERRLMYVAMTRAKKNLYLSSVTQRYHQGRRNISIQSQFIKELPSHLLHYLSPEKTHLGMSMSSSTTRILSDTAQHEP